MSATANVLVMASGVGPCPDLARTLSRQSGYSVALISDDETVFRRAGESVLPIKGTFTSRASAETAVGDAVRQLGSVHHVVMSSVPAGAVQSNDIDSMPYATWCELTHRAVKAVLYGLQASGAHLSSGGVITLLGPTVSLVGAERLVPLCAAVEAQRSLLKSAARQWGGRGIRLNWIAVNSATFWPQLADQALPEVPELGPPPPALGRPIDVEADVAPVVAFIGSERARAMTGLTLNLDGGDWMVP